MTDKEKLELINKIASSVYNRNFQTTDEQAAYLEATFDCIYEVLEMGD